MIGRDFKPLGAADWTFPFEFVGNKQMLIIVSEFTEPVFVLVGESGGSNTLTVLEGVLSIRQEELLKKTIDYSINEYLFIGMISTALP